MAYGFDLINSNLKLWQLSSLGLQRHYVFAHLSNDTVFDPVALTCGHIFCYMCACSAASVTIVDGLKAAEPKEKCPLCREARVYDGAVHLEELSMLLSRSCNEYWEQRLQTERVERVRQAKQHWESQCRAFMGNGSSGKHLIAKKQEEGGGGCRRKEYPLY
ncbi:hypothetical protein GBA52_027955 [Prunus armeniaca]|nr:hypothetical protein GBA52_027955 [Prunus armeniaca]